MFYDLTLWLLTPFCETKANINSSNQQFDLFSDLDFVKVRNKYFIAIIIWRISKVKISKGRLETKIIQSHKNRQPNFGHNFSYYEKLNFSKYVYIFLKLWIFIYRISWHERTISLITNLNYVFFWICFLIREIKRGEKYTNTTDSMKFLQKTYLNLFRILCTAVFRVSNTFFH